MNYLTDQQLLDLARELAPPRCVGYLQRSLPCDLDEKVGNLVDSMGGTLDAYRAKLLEAFSKDQSFGLMAYAERMAILAVRNRSEVLLRRGLLALVLENLKFDERESIMRLALLDHSARKIGVDAEQLFESVAKIAPQKVSQTVRQFAARSVQDKTIQSMGYSEESSSGGFSYSRNW